MPKEKPIADQWLDMQLKYVSDRNYSDKAIKKALDDAYEAGFEDGVNSKE